ncbi:MAG TPA: tryptophan 7-halogenase [Candidatus Angelobacter sp.]|jgi:halogenation protein CepH|nr:tryptophan 7-halogenase [Candidatus Angelobacter sp.]
MNQERFDVIVVGGGPAGSTAATFIAMEGNRVLLLEREKFPRHQIGESLLPATINGVCVMLGVSEELAQANFTYKLGGTYRWGKHPEPWSFTFGPSSMIPGSQAFAYQVERMKFDNILLNNARKKGVDVRERHTVAEVLEEAGRITRVGFTDAQGHKKTATARYVIDASGNTTTLSRNVGERVYSKFFQNVALYCYFKEGKRLPPPNSGNILSEAFSDGWCWYIPLSDELTSVGAVVAREHAERLKAGPEAAMQHFLNSTIMVKDFLSSATRITEGPYGQYRIRKDYSYCNTHFWAPGALLVGDAACFVDPVFSSGVHLATYSALLAARSVNSCLRGEIGEERSFSEFEDRYRKEFSNFYQFLLAFYDMDKDMDSYFWSARKVLNTEERANDAFIRLVSGTSFTGEPLFSDAADFFQAHAGVGDLFRKAYEEAKNPIDDGNFDTSRFDTAKFNPKEFIRDFRRGIVTLIRQANNQAPRHEMPVSDGGLVPSANGLSWVEPVEV